MSDPGAVISPEAVVIAARDQVSADLEGEAVILGLADGVYYGLDGVGARIWELLAQPRTAAELHGAITAEYDVDADTAWRDLSSLLAELSDRRLVEISPAAGA